MLRWAVPSAVIVLVIISIISYQFIVPRTSLEVRTVYHESPGGGGTGGIINVNVLLSNRGNRDLTDIACTVLVRDGSGSVLSRDGLEGTSLRSRDNTELRLSFVGNHYSTYTITLTIELVSMGDTLAREIVHTTREDSMNLVFVDRLG
jgi:hypothetical protein